MINLINRKAICSLIGAICISSLAIAQQEHLQLNASAPTLVKVFLGNNRFVSQIFRMRKCTDKLQTRIPGNIINCSRLQK